MVQKGHSKTGDNYAPNRLGYHKKVTKQQRTVVGTFLEPSCGRRDVPIHSILHSVA